MDIAMQLSSSVLSDEQLMMITRDLARDISDETDIANRLEMRDAARGAKGDPITATLILTFLSSGAAVALFEVLKAYFNRDSSLSITFKKADGSEVSVSAKNMDPDTMDETIARLQSVMEH